MLKNLENLINVQILSKLEQKEINGGNLAPWLEDYEGGGGGGSHTGGGGNTGGGGCPTPYTCTPGKCYDHTICSCRRTSMENPCN